MKPNFGTMYLSGGIINKKIYDLFKGDSIVMSGVLYDIARFIRDEKNLPMSVNATKGNLRICIKKSKSHTYKGYKLVVKNDSLTKH